MEKEKVIHFFRDVLKDCNRMHYSELINCLQCLDTNEKHFFDSYSDFRRRWFFKVNPLEFIIENDGYVYLTDKAEESVTAQMKSEDSTTKRNDQEESNLEVCEQQNLLPDTNNLKEKAVIELLTRKLWRYGSMYYLTLINSKDRSEEILVHTYFKNFSPSEALEFFKDHRSNFMVLDDIYVALSRTALNKFENEVKMKQNKIVNYFISLLRTTQRSLYYTELVSRLRSSTLDLCNYFDSYTEIELREFFKKHFSQSQLHYYTFVSLQKVDEEILAEAGTEVGCESISSKKKHAMSEAFSDFKIPSEDTVVKSFISTLSEYGPMHYNALMRCARDEPKVEFFKQLSSPDKVRFIVKHNNDFAIGKNGFVSLTDVAKNKIKSEKEREEMVLDYLVRILETHEKMHFVQLVLHFQSSELEINNYFDTFTRSDVKEFFQMHNSRFVVGKGNIVSLQNADKVKAADEEASEVNPDDEEASKTNFSDKVASEANIADEEAFEANAIDEGASKANETASYASNLPYEGNTQAKTDPCGTDEQGEGKISSALRFDFDRSVEEDRVIAKLVSALLEYGTMHYLALIKCAHGKRNKMYFAQKGSIDKLLFFMDHADMFMMGSNGYVTPSSFVLDTIKTRDDEVADYFISVLKKKDKMKPIVLVRSLKKSELDAKDYFHSFSVSEACKFFSRRPSRFVLWHTIDVARSRW